MRELIFKFFTVEAYAVRMIRLVFVGLGTAIVGGQIPAPVWIGYALGIVGAAISGNGTKSGLPVTPGKLPQ